MKLFFYAFIPLYVMPLLLALIGTINVSAEPESPPSPPLVGKAPPVCRWIVIVKQKLPLPPISKDPIQKEYQALVAVANPRMLQRTIEKSGDNFHEETDWEDGTKDVSWFYQGFVFTQLRTGSPEQILCVSSTEKDAPIKPTEDFPELDWITAKTFAGITNYGGVKCYLYTSGSEPNITSAWVDFKSRLPVAVDGPATLNTYTFSSGSSSIAPEGIFAARYQSMMKAKEIIERTSGGS